MDRNTLSERNCVRIHGTLWVCELRLTIEMGEREVFKRKKKEKRKIIIRNKRNKTEGQGFTPTYKLYN